VELTVHDLLRERARLTRDHEKEIKKRDEKIAALDAENSRLAGQIMQLIVRVAEAEKKAEPARLDRMKSKLRIWRAFCVGAVVIIAALAHTEYMR
jgi:septal ring factor EnvC (AmiA/AmiB activator)